LIFEGFEAFLTMFSLFLIGGGTIGEVVGGVATEDGVAVSVRRVILFTNLLILEVDSFL